MTRQEIDALLKQVADKTLEPGGGGYQAQAGAYESLLGSLLSNPTDAHAKMIINVLKRYTDNPDEGV